MKSRRQSVDVGSLLPGTGPDYEAWQQASLPLSPLTGPIDFSRKNTTGLVIFLTVVTKYFEEQLKGRWAYFGPSFEGPAHHQKEDMTRGVPNE